MKKGHLTDSCDHDEKLFCVRCEYGCTDCGKFDGQICEECEGVFPGKPTKAAALAGKFDRCPECEGSGFRKTKGSGVYINDDGRCEECAESRAQYHADCVYESMKEGF